MPSINRTHYFGYPIAESFEVRIDLIDHLNFFKMVASSKMLLLQFSRIAAVLSLYQTPILASPLPPPLAHSPAQLDLTVTVLTDNDLEG